MEGRKHRFGGLGATFLLVLLGVLLQLPTYDRSIVPIDEGQIASFAARILRGEVIYRDFYTGVAPGIYYVTAGLFAVFGEDLWTARAAQLALNVTLSVLLFRIGLRVATPMWSFLLALLYFPVVLLSFPTLTVFTYSPLSLAFALAALLSTLRYFERRTMVELVGAGLFLAACGLTKQNYGAFAVTAEAIVLCLAWWRGVLEAPELRRALVTVGATGAAATLLVVGPLVAAGAGPRMLRYTAGTISTSQFDAFSQPIPPIWRWQNYEEGKFLFFYLPSALFDYVLSAQGPMGIPLSEFTRWNLVRAGYGGVILSIAGGWVALLWRLRRSVPERWVRQAAVVVFAQLLFLGLFPSAIWSHLVAIAPPAFVVAAMLMSALSQSRVAAARMLGKVAASVAAAVLAGMIVFTSVISSDLRHWNSEPMPGARASTFVRPHDARMYEAVLRFLLTCAKPQEPIFAAPDMPVVYFLAERPNATPYEMLIPGDIEEDLLLTRLEESGTACIVYNPNMYFHFVGLESYLPGFVDYLRTRFHTASVLDDGQRRWQALVRQRPGTP